MRLNRKQIALIKIAQMQVQMDDASYRSVLAEIAGVISSTELNQEGFNALMGFFEYLGFAPMIAKGVDYGKRDGIQSRDLPFVLRTNAFAWHEHWPMAFGLRG